MKKSTRTIITSVAIAGILSGTAVRQAHAREDASTNKSATTAGKAAKKAPKVSSCAGQNDCKGIGGCKTDAHACKFKNDCKGKGGCSITKDDIKKWEKMQKEKKS